MEHIHVPLRPLGEGVEGEGALLPKPFQYARIVLA